MTADLEREAREAADRRNRDSRHPTSAETPHGAYMSGYLAAATLREKELTQLRQMADLSLDMIESRNTEIATLRARVAELEERAAQWVPESGLKSLMDHGWTEFYNDKRGNEPRLWLMVPPIPLPEGKSETDGQDSNR